MNNSSSGGALLIFTKPPVAGKVKTRLIPGVGRQRALTIYEELLTKTLSTARKAAFASTQLWVSSEPEHTYFTRIKGRHSFKLYQQQGKDLGQRMFNAFNIVLRRYSYAVIIGSDCPTLMCSDLMTAKKCLERETDIVLGPAVDGGYYLIGLSENNARIFSDIKWGRESVFADTCVNISRLNWKLDTLPKRWDVDRMADLLPYFKQKRAGSLLYY